MIEELLKTKPVIIDVIERVVDKVRENLAVYDITFDETFSGPGAPFFMPGHRQEIANNLLEMNSSYEHRYRKYPLFALNTDIVETIEGGLVEYSLNIAILCYTDPNYTTPQRKELVFKPTLYPLYQLFMTCLAEEGFFWEQNGEQTEQFPHDAIDRYYWGVREGGNSAQRGNTANIFEDPLDAIEIVNLRVKRNLVC